MERRSWQRAIAAHVLSRTSNKNPGKIIEQAWPRDNRAFLISKGAVAPTSRADYPAYDIVESSRSDRSLPVRRRCLETKSSCHRGPDRRSKDAKASPISFTS